MLSSFSDIWRETQSHCEHLQHCSTLSLRLMMCSSSYDSQKSQWGVNIFFITYCQYWRLHLSVWGWINPSFHHCKVMKWLPALSKASCQKCLLHIWTHYVDRLLQQHIPWCTQVAQKASGSAFWHKSWVKWGCLPTFEILALFVKWRFGWISQLISP